MRSILICWLALATARAEETGFTSLFNGKDLTGWAGDTKGYVAEDGMIVCRPGGNLYTEKEFSDFIFRFEFKLTPGANNGIGIRWPGLGDAAYGGMEIQVLDDTAEKYKNLHAYQFHGSIYGIVPARRGHQQPVGEWNVEEISAIGSRIKVTLNGVVIVDVDLAGIKQLPEPDMHDLTKHPGMHNKSGRIGFLGHGDLVYFRNLSVRDLSNGVPAPPTGYKALFNGHDLTGWKGLPASPHDNPIMRAKLSPDALATVQAAADADMRAHWKAENGMIVFDGKGQSLATAKDYGDFELLVDWKIPPGGDSGIYLRGSPQVQIWDHTKNPAGSGGLYNNQQNPRNPTVCADKPLG
ncbi:MAG: DUF1080 domain-containing protein, partial [Verrucomicrobia bacterium]|nr:DUF1080 domain-containing protein [Verrucomicrobiota bacterium]